MEMEYHSFKSILFGLGRTCIILGLITLLGACGGGSDREASPVPIITSFVSTSGTITAGTSINITAVFSNGTGSIDNSVGSVTSGTPVSVTPTSTTTYTLTVSNSLGTAVALVTVTVIPAPSFVVAAGPDQTIVLTDAANLDSLVTENGLSPQGTVTYSWSQLSGPGIANFTSPDSKQTSVTFTEIGSYTLNVLANTNSQSANDSLDITVNLKAAGATGLMSRPSNITECVAPATPPTVSSILLDNPFPNLPTLATPLAMYMAPADSSSWYVVQQTGQVIKFANNAAVSSVSTFINIADARLVSGGERGLLGMAFHPDFVTNGYVYLSYTNNSSGLNSRISRFNLDGTGQVLDPSSEVIILTVPQPFSNHNGGQIMFGPDGYLYIGFGDGGSAGDPNGNGQDTNTLLGAILRIDVGDGSSGSYTIPADNPFVSGGGQPEIFAYGLRNPWRWSFDSATNKLWAGDVGQGDFEEIDIITKGNNYGWNTMEGTHCFNDITESCDQSGLTLPVAEYDHSQGFSVTGGYVYHGSNIAFLQGHYLYADYVTGRIWGLEETGVGQFTSTELLDTTLSIASFAEDHAGELYIVNMGGSIHKIAEDPSGQAGQIPTLLSGWGCFQAGDTKTFSNSVIPYDINALLWSDSANKGRFMAIPNGTTIDVDSQGRFDFPVGSVVGKHFYLSSGQLIETRLLLHHEAPHGWKGYSYEWNDTQTDATLLSNFKNKDFSGQTWHYPSSAECDACHTSIAGFTLGPEIGQLNRMLVYPSPGTAANQLITLESIGVLSAALSDTEKSTAFYAIDDTAYSAELRARSYLHSNCAGCHQLGGPGGGNMDLRMATSLADTGICNKAPLGDTLGLSTPVILAPGDPDSSILVLRMEDLGQHRMPPLGTAEVDTQAMSVIRSWISGLSTCP